MEPGDRVGRGSRRAGAAAALLALLAAFAGCGGGFVVVGDSGVSFQIDTFVDGFAFGRPVHAGETVTVAIQAGQSIELEASRPATWRFSVAGGPFLAAGTTATVAGLAITVLPLSTSGVRVATTLTGPAPLPVSVTLTASSDLGNRDVATVQLQVR
ncbi:MAG: hypothetical protein ACXWJJ_01095 [Ramlibacter sp.]